jgi:RNA polymerase sigma factor (sigma-70 family)
MRISLNENEASAAGSLDQHDDVHDAPSDNEVMLRVCTGEIEALGILFQRYQPSLLRFFLRFTQSHSLSEDLVQDVFVRILKYRHTFGADSEFSAWMYGIARNLHYQQYRKREREVSLDEAALEKIATDELSPDELFSRRFDLHLLSQALTQLSIEKRELLELSRIRKLKYRNIAERLGCKVGTVKVRVLRATREIEAAFFKLFKPEQGRFLGKSGRFRMPAGRKPVQTDGGLTEPLGFWPKRDCIAGVVIVDT